MSCCTKALPPTTTSAPRSKPRNVATKRSRSSVRHRSNPAPDRWRSPGARACRRARRTARRARPARRRRAIGATCGGRHQVAGGLTLGVGHRRQRLLRQQPPDVGQQRELVVLIGRHQIVQRRRRARTGGRRRALPRSAARIARATSRARSRVGSAITVPPEMPRPNARSMLSFQRRVSFISGAGRAQVLEVRLERAGSPCTAHAPTPDPTTADQHGRSTIAGRRRGASRARPLPSRAGERPPASPRASSAASAAGNTRKVAIQQNRIPTPPMSPKCRKPRKSVASSDAYETDAVSAAASGPAQAALDRRAQRRDRIVRLRARSSK